MGDLTNQNTVSNWMMSHKDIVMPRSSANVEPVDEALPSKFLDRYSEVLVKFRWIQLELLHCRLNRCKLSFRR